MLLTWLLAYDISDERHRRRCRRTLRGLAEGYQKSVFEVQARTNDVRDVMETLAKPLEGHDSLLAARVLPFGHAWRLGKGIQAPTGELIIIQ